MTSRTGGRSRRTRGASDACLASADERVVFPLICSALRFEQVCPTVNSTDEAAARHCARPPPASGRSDDSRGPEPNRVRVPIANVLDQRLLQERAVARSGSVPEAARGRARLVDVEGRDTDDARTMADSRLVWVGWNAADIVRGAIRAVTANKTVAFPPKRDSGASTQSDRMALAVRVLYTGASPCDTMTRR